MGFFGGTDASKNGADNKAISAVDNKTVSAAESKTVSAVESKTDSGAGSKTGSGAGSKTVSGADSKTIIADGCQITGELTTLGAVLLEGEFDGTIKEASSVSVGTRGRMKGVIRAKSVILSGQVEGEIRCSTLEMLSQARVTGDVYCEQLTVEKGGVLDGRCSNTPFEATGTAQLVLPASRASAIIQKSDS
ncbi:MAG: polymer-forming cytoskeletal protein [Pseudomonadota bacterium]